MWDQLIVTDDALKEELINSRLFKWSLILSPLKDNVTIVHRPGRLHNNVDPLSRYPMSVNLVHVGEEWQSKLWEGYYADRTFRRILKSLMRIGTRGGLEGGTLKISLLHVYLVLLLWVFRRRRFLELLKYTKWSPRY